jgi:hypothetical protein
VEAVVLVLRDKTELAAEQKVELVVTDYKSQYLEHRLTMQAAAVVQEAMVLILYKEMAD